MFSLFVNPTKTAPGRRWWAFVRLSECKYNKELLKNNKFLKKINKFVFVV
jgi:hypothetical protein